MCMYVCVGHVRVRNWLKKMCVRKKLLFLRERRKMLWESVEVRERERGMMILCVRVVNRREREREDKGEKTGKIAR